MNEKREREREREELARANPGTKRRSAYNLLCDITRCASRRGAPSSHRDDMENAENRTSVVEMSRKISET
ncbi:hypothetical protein ACFW04_007494 [Cataglyphis niger]